MSYAAVDLTKEWREVVRNVRYHQLPPILGSEAEAQGPRSGMSAAEVIASTSAASWRTPLTPFMQQATELNCSIKEMHTFLLQHFLDYVDLHHSLPSKRSLMADEDKDIIDLEVTSFMTACAAGVDALKALLQRERLRRVEQEASAGGGGGVGDGRGSSEGDGGVAGIGMRPGSRPAHENAAVTFLFERLKAVTEVAETMQTERHKRAAQEKARFYNGPSTQSRTAAEAAAVAANSSANTPAGDVWGPTPEELEEERLLQESFFPSSAYRDESGGQMVDWMSRSSRKSDGQSELNGQETTGTGVEASHILDKNEQQSSMFSSALEEVVSETAGKLESTSTRISTEDNKRLRRENDRNSGGDSVHDARGDDGSRISGTGLRHSGGSGKDSDGKGVRFDGNVGIGRHSGGRRVVEEEAAPVVSTGALQAENADLVARYQNELDDARLVETKMSEISGLMGLFTSKVVEQQGGMEHVFDAAVSVNDKLIRGGQHLEKAIERGGAFRLFYAWFMVGASLCLLFLHFYNP